MGLHGAGKFRHKETCMNLKLALITGGALFATPAFAQDEPPAGGTVEAAAGAEVSTDPAVTTDPALAVAADVGMSWSKIAIERPYVRPAGKISAMGELGIIKITFTNPLDPTMSSTLTGDAFSVGGAYGVTDKITAGATYGFTPGLFDAESDIVGILDIFGGMQLVHSSKMSVAATVNLGVDLGGTDAMGEDAVLLDLSAGLGARYNLSPQMGLFTGSPYGPFGEIN